MADLNGVRVGCAMTGSFCTFARVFEALRELRRCGADLVPILSFNAGTLDTRFQTAREVRDTLTEIAGRGPLRRLEEVEPIGPRKLIDVLAVAPCTGNTLAKLAAGIADTPATLAVKSHLRNGRPVVVAVSSNDALAQNARSLGQLLSMRNVYFVPFGQDDAVGKPNSLVAKFEALPEAVEWALSGRQLQPILR